jgi:hypothetical protein
VTDSIIDLKSNPNPDHPQCMRSRTRALFGKYEPGFVIQTSSIWETSKSTTQGALISYSVRIVYGSVPYVLRISERCTPRVPDLGNGNSGKFPLGTQSFIHYKKKISCPPEILHVNMGKLRNI